MENSLNKYIVYITTNTVNNKIYVGVHTTDSPYKFDGYLGNGSWIDRPSTYNKGKYPIHAAILKYGTHAFSRKTLKVFDNMQDALDLEAWIVTEEFVKRSDTYNATVGGGMPPLANKKVFQFSLNGEFIKEWESETSITDYFDSHVRLSGIIKGKRNFAGFFWSFDKTINVEEYKKTTIRGFIDQYDLEGNYITSYKSTNVTSQKMDIEFKKLNTSIFRQRPCEGYYFLNSGVDIYEVLQNNISRKVGKCPVFRYTTSGNFDKEYSSINKALKDLDCKNEATLKKAIVNGTEYKGYLWSCYKSESIDLSKKGLSEKPNILQYDKSGTLVKEWENYKECKKEFPYCLDCCRGKIKSTKGYIFKYKTKDIV